MHEIFNNDLTMAITLIATKMKCLFQKLKVCNWKEV